MLLLTACANERVIAQPEIVRIIHTEYVPVPADLTSPIAVQSIPNGVTYGELIEIHARDRETVRRLNGKLAGIRSLGNDDEH